MSAQQQQLDALARLATDSGLLVLVRPDGDCEVSNAQTAAPLTEGTPNECAHWLAGYRAGRAAGQTSPDWQATTREGLAFVGNELARVARCARRSVRSDLVWLARVIR